MVEDTRVASGGLSNLGAPVQNILGSPGILLLCGVVTMFTQPW